MEVYGSTRDGIKIRDGCVWTRDGGTLMTRGWTRDGGMEMCRPGDGQGMEVCTGQGMEVCTPGDRQGMEVCRPGDGQGMEVCRPGGWTRDGGVYRTRDGGV